MCIRDRQSTWDNKIIYSQQIMADTKKIDLHEAIAQLQGMFPHLTSDIIESALQKSNYRMDIAVEALIGMNEQLSYDQMEDPSDILQQNIDNTLQEQRFREAHYQAQKEQLEKQLGINEMVDHTAVTKKVSNPDSKYVELSKLDTQDKQKSGKREAINEFENYISDDI
eukprot:TRINITY_DN9560_c0_g1_i4.p1 TRINITY_DN9560_c0_g1~~TRINITY_DN9560_c0_g1_i4.p1  ORF type:complete len:168 (+),score=29.27 TRINITY_DN9560_c0_g1_i4:60-563(+)